MSFDKEKVFQVMPLISLFQDPSYMFFYLAFYLFDIEFMEVCIMIYGIQCQ